MSGTNAHSPSMHSWLRSLAGRFIVFDGPDGSGKSTQFQRFADLCLAEGIDLCPVREPGGTDVGEQIRSVLLDPGNGDMTLRCELMLYMASRAQLVERIIRPALQRQALVLADRFVSSTLAYQGTAGGISREEIMSIARVAIDATWPDLVVVFDVDDTTAVRRMGGKQVSSAQAMLFADRMEQKNEAFRCRVRQGYLDQIAADPARHLLIDASKGAADDVFEVLCRKLEEWAEVLSR